MAKDLRYYLTIWMRDQATAGLDKVRKGLLRVGDAAKAVRSGPGAAMAFGGPVAGLLLGGLSTAIHVVTGLVGIVAGIASTIVTVFVNLAAQIVSIFTGLVGTVGGILWKLVKTATVVGAGVGAALGVALYKGISENFKEGQIKAVLKRRIGAGWEAAWKEIEKLRTETPFSAEQLGEALITLQRADLKDPARYLGVIADTATGAAASMTEVADLFVRMATGGGGRLPEMLRRFGFRPEQVQSIRTVADLARLLQQRFGGVNAEVDRFDAFGNIWEQVRLGLRDLTSALANYLLPILNAVTDKLEQLRESPAFARLKDKVKEVGQAIVEFIGGAINWLMTRAWSWDNIKNGAIEALGFIRDQAGTVFDWLKSKFTVLKTHALDIVDEVVVYLYQRFADALTAFAADLKELGAGTEKKAREKPTISEKGIAAVLPGVTAEDLAKHRIVPTYGGPAGPVQQAEITAGQAMWGAGGMIQQIVSWARQRGAEAPQAAIAREAERTAAQKAADELATALAEALAAKAPEIVGMAFPARPGAQGLQPGVPGGLRVGEPEGGLTEGQRYRRGAEELTGAAGLLRERGYGEQAGGLEQRAAQQLEAAKAADQARANAQAEFAQTVYQFAETVKAHADQVTSQVGSINQQTQALRSDVQWLRGELQRVKDKQRQMNTAKR
jgi:hypothetical protein